MGTATVSINTYGGTVSGNVVGGDSISVSGQTVTASLISKSVSASGDTTAAAIGVPTGNIAKEDTKIADDASTSVANPPIPPRIMRNKKEETRQKAGAARSIGRVTVILPQKN